MVLLEELPQHFYGLFPMQFFRQMQSRFPVLPANSTVFFDPPVSTGAREKTTVPSLSRTFHSVRWG